MTVLALLLACAPAVSPTPVAAIGQLSVVVAAPPSEVPSVELEDGTRLLASSLPDHLPAAGGPLEVSLWIQTTPRPDPDDVVLVELVDLGGTTLAEGRTPPLASTPHWQPGDLVRVDMALELPGDRHPVAVQFRLVNDHWADTVQAAWFWGPVSVGWVTEGPRAPTAATAPVAEEPTAVLALGGDIGLGRRSNALVKQHGPLALLGALPELAAADLALANLETSVTLVASDGVDKGEVTPFYFRARPETLEALKASGVDVVGIANNHIGDYGPRGLEDTMAWLDHGGLAHVGAGATAAQACAPVLARAGGLVVAIFAIDATQPHFAALEGRPGTCFLPLRDPGAWRAMLEPAVRDARRAAHVVLVTAHWGDNLTQGPTPAIRTVARIAIEAGADAVVGSSAHRVHGLEIVHGRPVLYDLGNLAFDASEQAGADHGLLAWMRIDRLGVVDLKLRPVQPKGRTVHLEGSKLAAGLRLLASRSIALGTRLELIDNEARWARTGAVARPGPTETWQAEPSVLPSVDPEPPGCRVAGPPPEARLPAPLSMGEVELVGARWSPTAMTERGLVILDTWWQVSGPLKPGEGFTYRVVKEDGSSVLAEGWQEPCDWRLGADALRVGETVHDRAFLRPRRTMEPGRYQIQAGRYKGGQPRYHPENLGSLEVAAP
jgi:poly-gamma-glutamate capsule biosynthesis protein CapA/YwtB (metallophosphatase superfamily)